MRRQSFNPRTVWIALLWGILPAAGVAPFFWPGFADGYGGGASGALILLVLTLLAAPTLIVHLSAPRARPITSCILFSLFLHMMMVMLFSRVGLETPFPDEDPAGARHEVAFGLESPLESAAREAVREKPVEWATPVRPTMESRTATRPKEVSVKSPPERPRDEPRALERPDDRVKAPTASKPEVRVADRPQPRAETQPAELSKAEIARVKAAEREAEPESEPTPVRRLDPAKAKTTAAADPRSAVSRPAPEERTAAAERLAADAPRAADAGRMRVEDRLRPAEVRSAAPDRMASRAESLAAPDSPAAAAAQPEAGRNLSLARMKTKSETAVAARKEEAPLKTVEADRSREVRWAAASEGVKSEATPRAPGAELTRAEVRRAAEPLVRLDSAMAGIEGARAESPAPARERTDALKLPDRAAATGGEPSLTRARPTVETGRESAVAGPARWVADAPSAMSEAGVSGGAVSDPAMAPMSMRDGEAPVRGMARGISAMAGTRAEESAEAGPVAGAAPRGAFGLTVERGGAVATEEGEGKPAVRGVAIAERGDRPADTLVENTREEWTPGSGAAAGADRQSLARAARGVRDDNWERLAGMGGAPSIAGSVSDPATNAGVAANRAEVMSGRTGWAFSRRRTGVGEGEPVAAGSIAAPLAAGRERPVEVESLAGQTEGSGVGGAAVTKPEMELAATAPVGVWGAEGTALRVVPGGPRAERGTDGERSVEPAAAVGGERMTGRATAWTVTRAEGGGAPEGGGLKSGPKPSAAAGGEMRATPGAGKWEVEAAAVSAGGGAVSAPRGLDAPARASVRAGVETVPVAARAAMESGGAGEESAGAGTEGQRPTRELRTAKATADPAVPAGGGARPNLSLSGLPEGGETTARKPSRLMDWLVGSVGKAQASVPDELPRGDREAAYRTVSAAEQKAVSGLPRQKLIYSLRSPEMRQEHIVELGGSAETERAVERALAWLARAQSDDGRWSVARFKGVDVCGGAGDRTDGDAAMTGLALLAYLGAGYTQTRGDYQATVRKGLAWLIAGQTPNGDLRRGSSLYAQAMAAAALCEAYSLTDDPALREPARKAIRFICDSQNLGAGWRYEPRSDNDTSVSGWMVLALKSGELAGIPVDPQHFRWTGLWLDLVRRGKSGGLYAYKEGHGPTPVMTAEGWFCQLFMGEQARTRGEAESAAYLMENLPAWEVDTRGTIHFYYWYYATLALHLSGGDAFETWNRALRDALLKGQRQEGPAAGSWDPVDPLGERGGRVYSTTMATLCLEVYYRYLPFYRK